MLIWRCVGRRFTVRVMVCKCLFIGVLDGQVCQKQSGETCYDI